MAKRKPPAEARKSKPAWEDIQFSKEELRYKEEEWFVPSHDDRGHSAREWVRLMPQMAAELELLLQAWGKLAGYQTKGDIIRHGLARHICWLHILEPATPRTYLGAIQAQLILLAEDRHKTATEQVFRELFERVEYHLQAGNQGEAVRLLAQTKAAMDNTPDTPWKRNWLTRFRRSYGVFLQPAGTATVTGPQELTAGSGGVGNGGNGGKVDGRQVGAAVEDGPEEFNEGED